MLLRISPQSLGSMAYKLGAMTFFLSLRFMIHLYLYRYSKSSLSFANANTVTLIR